jgi:ankyrin repeat protein
MTTRHSRGVPLVVVIGILLAAGGGMMYLLHTLAPDTQATRGLSTDTAPSASLHALAAAGDTAALERELAKGASPDTQSDFAGAQSVTPLMVAVQRGQAQAVAALLKAKPNVNARSREGTTALILASGWCGKDIVDALLAAGASVDARDDAGRSALMLAAARGQPEVVARLIEAGADTRARNKWGQTPLLVAADTGSPAKVDLLLAKNADPNDADYEGRSAAARAAARPADDAHALDILKSLVRAGAMLDRADRDGVTPLMIAAKEGDLPRVILLLNSGANAKLKDSLSRTAADWARDRDTDQAREIVKTLSEAQK